MRATHHWDLAIKDARGCYWKEIGVHSVKHFWQCLRCGEGTKISVGPNYYETRGVPKCPICGDTMVYKSTYILKRKAKND
jgi:hypothetical protein